MATQIVKLYGTEYEMSYDHSCSELEVGLQEDIGIYRVEDWASFGNGENLIDTLSAEDMEEIVRLCWEQIEMGR